MIDFQKYFEYRDDGSLVWKVSRPGGNAKAGQTVGNRRKDGYVTVGLLGKKWLLHRIIFAMHHDRLPEVIDHIDGDPWNNRIENLREATNTLNQYNRKVDCRNKLGAKGVYFHRRDKLYCVRMKVGEKVKTVGYFKDLELAELVATEARLKYHGQFARHE
jgi:hypothetical protein